MIAPPAIPAATLIVLRDRTDAPPEMLMVERSARMAFAPGALVFPGGRIEPGDRLLAVDDDGAARIAAIRETVEEAGVLVAVDAPGEAVPGLRAAIADGAPFGDAMLAAGAVPRPDLLSRFAHWRPTHQVSRIFDTQFYLARAPAGDGSPMVDGTENVRAFWVGAAEVLAQVRAGEATMIFPTRRTVERLARFTSVDEAFADVRRHPVRVIEPWVEERDRAAWLCIPDDLGFPITAERLADATRG